MEEKAIPYFTPFEAEVDLTTLPEKFQFPISVNPDPYCLLAAKQVQDHLKNRADWEHNFGLQNDQEGEIIGKMFGVLVVQTPNNETGYLAGFSGKIAGGNHHYKFVPPVYDSLHQDGFLNEGMRQLGKINEQIKIIASEGAQKGESKISQLKEKRKALSNKLTNQLFESYAFLNAKGESKSLKSIFNSESLKSIPGGAGECAAPKLLQYAYLNKMKPLAMAEFWWGLHKKQNPERHGKFFPSCEDKCHPILGYMLKGLDLTSAL